MAQTPLFTQLVSIIIPVHNRFEWFKDCLQSVFDQEYRAIEIIVVDDASTTHLADFIALTWPGQASRVVVIRHNQSLGPGLARETGRLIAKGDYISYLDSDDVIHPSKIRKQVNYLSAHPEIGMCYCRSSVFSELPLTGQEDEYRPVRVESDDILSLLLTNRPWGTGACTWTRTASDLIGPWSALRAGEDQEYEFRAGIHKIKTYQLPEVLFSVRRSPKLGQLTQQSEICRLEDSQMYISIAHQACQFRGCIDEINRYRIARRLVRSVIFLLSKNQKKGAAQSMSALMKLTQERFGVQLVFAGVAAMVELLPTSTAYVVLHRVRYRLLGLLSTSK